VGGSGPVGSWAGLREALGASRGVVFRGVREEGVGEEGLLDRIGKEGGQGSRMEEMAIVKEIGCLWDDGRARWGAHQGNLL
jgi:hypothetical protein